tara:strand:+ start:1315 stop:1530 length:216 start_codon:yes stop_codon:yes gene_type:complete
MTYVLISAVQAVETFRYTFAGFAQCEQVVENVVSFQSVGRFSSCLWVDRERAGIGHDPRGGCHEAFRGAKG